MKKAIKIIGLALLGLVAVICLSAMIINTKGVPTFAYLPNPETIKLQVPRGDTALIEQGRKIAAALCVSCHRGEEEGKMIGKQLADLPPMFGKVYSGNITHDLVHGIGAWTDGELYHFLRTGIRKDGSWAPPFMPKFPRMAESDMQAVIAWLRSDDAALAADPRSYLPNRWNFVVKTLTNTVFSPPPLPTAPIQLPDTINQVVWGKYLANDLLDCYSCHSADFVKVDALNPPASEGYYGGGNEMKNLEGQVIRTANLTPHPEYGIGNLTTEQFINAVKYGQKPGGGTLRYPMPPFSTLTDSEVIAIQAFLKTVPIIDKKVER